MKTIITLAFLWPCLLFGQKKKPDFWVKQSAIFAIGFIGGVADGWNEEAKHNYYRIEAKLGDLSDQWHNPRISNNNKDDRGLLGRTVFVFTSDQYHLNKFVNNLCWASQAGISLTLYEKPNWKQIALQCVVMWGSHSLGKGLTHKFFE